MKKLLPLVLSTVLLSMSLYGCGSSTPATDPAPATEDAAPADDTAAPADDTAAPADDAADDTAAAGAIDPSTLDPVELTMWFHGSNVTDDSAVMAEVNKYLTEKLNCTLSPIWGTWGDFDTTVPQAIQGGDNVDLYFTSSWTADEYNAYARNGAWMKMDDLIAQYAADYWQTIPSVLRDGATINGSDGVGVYAFPGWKDYANEYCWDVNVTLLEKYGYTVEDIQNTDYYGFGEILETVKQGEGADFYPLLIEGAVLERMVNNTYLVTGDIQGAVGFAALSYYFDPTDVTKAGAGGHVMVNKFASPEFKKFAEKTREYFLAGYINPAMGLAEQANSIRTTAQQEAQYLIGTQANALGYELAQSEVRGITVKMVPTSQPYTDTTAAQGAMFAIPANAKNPERAMMLLNLLNTDPQLMTMLTYGLEGTHYEYNDDGTISWLDMAAHEAYQPWVNGMGNINILPPTDVEGPTFREDFKNFYATAKPSPILGYAFIDANVQNEKAAIATVTAEYALALCAGTVDPATALPEFLERLETAGISKYVEEAQAQLDEFLANQQ